MQELLVNEAIHFKEVLVINSKGEQLGVMSTRSAISLAHEEDLDLVCVAPKAATPVCKILDYGKYRFEQQKKEKAAKKNQHNSETSEIQITYTIQEHDIQTKVRTAKRLIEDKGNSIRWVLRLRGREMSYLELAKEKVNYVVQLCSEFSKVKKPLFVEGRDIKVIIEGK